MKGDSKTKNTSKIRPKPRAPSYADKKSKIMIYDIYVSQLHLVHQTQYFIEWWVIDHLSFKSKFYRGQNSSKIH